MSDFPIILRMHDICMEYPGVKALKHVDFEVRAGMIQALVGANGAGKSTLMKVLMGAEPDYKGSIFIDEKEVEMRSTYQAQSLGIQMVFQEVDTALVPNLSVGENIMLNATVNQMKRKTFMNWNQLHAQAQQILKKLQISLDTHQNVRFLSLAQKQMTLIARAIVQKSRVLILDEPTAPLSSRETQELFSVVRDLATCHNVGIVFISHRLPELFEICQRVTIMRDGNRVTEAPIGELNMQRIINHMLGKEYTQSAFQPHNVEKEITFEVEHLEAPNGLVQNVSIYVRKGEVVGLSGLVGAGKTELCKTLFGAIAHKTGIIKLNGKTINLKSPKQAVERRLALVPEERRKEGVFVSLSVQTNLSIAALQKFCTFVSFLKPGSERANSLEIIRRLDIKTPTETQRVAYLSGGNQQKIAIGKWLNTEADVYLFDEPTKGIDVGAKADIFDLIHDLVSRGKSVIYATCDFSEILRITNRVYVMYNHGIAKELVTEQTDEAELLYYSTGGV